MKTIYVIVKRCSVFYVREGNVFSYDEHVSDNLCPQYGARINKEDAESKCEKLNKSFSKKNPDSVNACPFSVVSVKLHDLDDWTTC